MKRITTLKFMGRSFEIVKDGETFRAIEDKYITNGKTNQVLYGYQTFPSDTAEGCIGLVQDALKIQFLESQGYTHSEAICKVLNLPLSVAEKLQEVMV